MTESFPRDLPDLLRLACGQGQMRLNVFFGARANGRKHQANLANSGNGWTIDYDEDPLEAIARVLRIRFGAVLERQRQNETVHIVKPAGGGTGTGVVVDPHQIDIEEAIAAAAEPLGPSCFFCGRGRCESGCPGLPDPIHPDFPAAVGTLPDIDLEGLIG